MCGVHKLEKLGDYGAPRALNAHMVLIGHISSKPVGTIESSAYQVAPIVTSAYWIVTFQESHSCLLLRSDKHD